MGWITCDNAPNNDSMINVLTTLLNKCKIKIDMTKQRIM